MYLSLDLVLLRYAVGKQCKCTIRCNPLLTALLAYHFRTMHVSKKLHPFYFLNNSVKPRSMLIIFDTQIL